MGWGRLDDKFHSHRKILRLLDEPDGLAAVGLWTLALSWARDQHKRGETEALIPHGVPRRLSGCDPTLPALLVKVGLWTECADGWMIHDYRDYLPSDSMSSSRAEAGRKGGIASGKVRNEARSLLDEATSFEEEARASRSNEATAKQGGGLGIGSSKDLKVVETSVVRDDVDRLCDLLADGIEGNGSRRPAITQGWKTACRLLLDKDGKTETQVAAAISFSQRDEFWRSNILSMPALRKQYDKLRLAAARGKPAQQPLPGSPSSEFMHRR